MHERGALCPFIGRPSDSPVSRPSTIPYELLRRSLRPSRSFRQKEVNPPEIAHGAAGVKLVRGRGTVSVRHASPGQLIGKAGEEA